MISVVGATLSIMIYLSSTFATAARVDKIEAKLERIDKVSCAMAIYLQIPDMKKICTGEPL